MTTVHPTAIVHPRAELHESAVVGPYSVIGAGVRVGARTVLHNHVTVQGPTTLGEDNIVYPYAVLGAEPQDLKFKGHDTCLEIGSRNRIREHATVHRGTELGGGKTVIGSDTLIMVGVHIAHDCVIEDQVVIANATMLGGHCLVEFGAGLGGGAGVHHFTTIGTLSFVGGMARVNRDVPPYLVVEGSPAEPRKINTTALLRRGWSPEQVERLRAAYKALFRDHDTPVALAMEALRARHADCAPLMRLCDFLERTQDGIHGRHLESLRDADSKQSREG
ncbi:MAG TPA: acyl-[acyl-carrier-protein]--UDP-N-acetylglucosamine O-acyltransferase [Phycisphaerales bacterium]|nr:acyl-[acyl-carrier-protein]--UDP-N-acetylglucosamine O-acyltransferase [Phycisphaerales bacterium]